MGPMRLPTWMSRTLGRAGSADAILFNQHFRERDSVVRRRQGREAAPAWTASP
jgi:hypothetical protein